MICDKHGDCGFLKPFAALVFFCFRKGCKTGLVLLLLQQINRNAEYPSEKKLEISKAPGPRPSSQEARRAPTGSTILSKFVCMVYAVYICIYKLIHI